MAFSSFTHSLSSIEPVKFTYKFNKEEKMSNKLSSFRNGFRYYKHDVFDRFKDAALSKKNCLILTNNISLKDVFDVDSKQLNVGTIAGSLFLKTPSDEYVRMLDNELFIGGIGENVLITICPLGNNIVELKIANTNRRIEIDENYPYQARISEDILDPQDVYRQRFETDYAEGRIYFKTKTKEGYRFLSYSAADKKVRAVGVMFNDLAINSYLWNTEFVSSENGLYYNFNATTNEVKYYNYLNSFINKQNVDVKEKKEKNTSLLLSYPTMMAALSGEVPVNISLTKTNFSAAGTYLTR